jgi:hypothetical protein
MKRNGENIMSEKKAVNETNTIETPAGGSPATSYSEGAQAFVEQLRRMREAIPHFVMPTAKGGRKPLASAGSVPPAFVELTTVARTNTPELGRGGTMSPAETRDLMAYADAYEPVCNEIEAMAEFVRFSIAAARYKAGKEALTTYAVARRLVRSAEHAALAPYVAEMRRVLGNRGKRLKAAALARKQKQAEAATPSSSDTEQQ